MKRLVMFSVVAMLMLAVASPALATGAGGAGMAFGQHHATHAQEMGGFTGTENPGMHQGFAGWTGV